MVERSLSMREALGSMPRFSNFFLNFEHQTLKTGTRQFDTLALIAQLVRAYG